MKIKESDLYLKSQRQAERKESESELEEANGSLFSTRLEHFVRQGLIQFQNLSK